MTLSFDPKKLKKNTTINTIPGDKSISHRAIILGSLAENTSSFHNFLFAEDCLNTIKIFQDLGVNITADLEKKCVTIQGVGLNGLKKPRKTLDVGNSGTGIRLITGVLAGQHFDCTITGDHSIQNRPMKRIMTPLSLMGSQINGKKIDNKDDISPPLSILGRSLKAIQYTLPVASAQVKSAILFASLFAKGTTTIKEPTPSRDHSEVMLKTFGANITTKENHIYCNGDNPLTNPFNESIPIPSDFSSAAFFIVLGLIHQHSTIKLTNIGLNPTRCRLLNILQEMGGNIEITQYDSIEPYGDIVVTSSKLKNITISKHDIPYIIDEIPILSVAAMFASEKMTITHADELRVKESDRIKSTVDLINQFGGNISELDDGFILTGGFKPKQPSITSYYDHRIAMSAIIASIASGISIKIDDISSIKTSFPSFLDIVDTISQ
jgi:3-phosphoshikimate 1-carboxyvinyltransferase